MSPYQSDTEIENVVRAFEACEFGKDDFKHREHLVVAAWYVQMLGREAALDKMRLGLLRFLDHHEVDRKHYSEPVTVFWIERVAQRLTEIGAEISLAEKCNRIVESSEFWATDLREKADQPANSQTNSSS